MFSTAPKAPALSASKRRWRKAGVPVDYRDINLDTDEQRTEEFRTLNPSGKVPALHCRPARSSAKPPRSSR